MPQMSLFTRSEIATMRDRTRARNYSPEGEKFRRDHERRRRWAKLRNIAERPYWIAIEDEAAQHRRDGDLGWN